MKWLIVEKDTITNIIEADETFAKSIGAVATCLGADIGKPYPTIEQLRADKLDELNGCCSAAIYSGVTVGGKHYRLTENDQLSLNAAIGLATASGTSISYAADGETGTLMTAAELAAVGKAGYDWGYVCRSYYGLLYAWVARETDVDKLNTIKYGSKLPDDLMQQLGARCQSVGIDVTKYAALFTA